MKQIKIKTNLVGKEEVFKILALAQASKLGVLLQGAPGTGKTNLAIDFIKAQFDLTDPKEIDRFNKHGFFILETDEQTKNSEVKGNPNLRKLVEENKFEVDSPIADAQCIIINEIDKASSSLRNSFLGIMNEKVLFNGESKKRCVWQNFIGTCNKIPKDEADSPFWDRFILKTSVSRLSAGQITDYYRSGEKKYSKEIIINIPDEEDIKDIQLSEKYLTQFLAVVYSKCSDRTLTFVPTLVKYTSLIYDISIKESFIKVAEFLTDVTKAQELANILNKDLDDVYNKIKTLSKENDPVNFYSGLQTIQNKVKSLYTTRTIGQAEVDDIGRFLMDLEKKFQTIPEEAQKMLDVPDDFFETVSDDSVVDTTDLVLSQSRSF